MLMIQPAPVIQEYKAVEYKQIEEVGYITDNRTYTAPVASRQTSTAPARMTTPTPAPRIDASLQLINDTRQQHGLKALKVHGGLNASATAKCQHMLTHNYWSHTAPDGTHWRVFVHAQGIDGYKAEILARKYSSLEKQHQGWLNSSTHRSAILGNYNYFGIGRCSNITVVHFLR